MYMSFHDNFHQTQVTLTFIFTRHLSCNLINNLPKFVVVQSLSWSVVQSGNLWNYNVDLIELFNGKDRERGENLKPGHTSSKLVTQPLGKR